jgi:predicted histone-like DNA-binding protein
MGFYKKVQIKTKDKDGKVQTLWYPRSVLVGSPITTDQMAKRIAQQSTVAPADVKAVLSSLSGVMGEYMALGRSVKLDGIGSFYFSANSQGNGAESEKKCSTNQINGVKVVFIPETTYRRAGGSRQAVRALTDVDIDWVDVATLNMEDTEANSGEEPGGETPDTPDIPGGDTPGGNDNPGGGGGDDPNNSED